MSQAAFGDIFRRAIRLRCPRCGAGRLFLGWFRMHRNCEHCQLKYERAPGYFLGSTYINYGLTCLLMTVAYLGLHFGAGIENRTLTPPLIAFCVIFPLAMFRYARSLWLGLDCFFDRTGFQQDEGD